MAGMRDFLTVRRADDGTLIGEGFDGYDGVLFGGMVLAHAVAAATFEMPVERRLHSLHGYFLRPVMTGQPIVSRVDSVRDGRSFASRQVRLEQGGKPAFTMTCSFSADADGGYEYNMPSPSPLAPLTDFTIEQGPGPWQAAVVGPTAVRADGTRESTHRQWFRIPLDLPDNAHLHTALLAFTTDWTGIGGRPLRLDGDTTGMVSLDHAAWFHRPARADEWLHFDVYSLVNAGGRGLLRGEIRNTRGEIVASVAQEMLLAVT